MKSEFTTKRNNQEKKQKGQEIQTKKIIVSLLIYLIISLTFVSSYVVAQTDLTQGVIIVQENQQQKTESTEPREIPITGFVINDSANRTITDVGAKCGEKSDRVSGFVKTMDNGIIKTLETIASIMFMICTVASAIDTIINTVYQVIGCCFPNLINGVACAAKETEGKAWGFWFTTFVNPLCCFVNCGWCTGDSGKCMGVVGDFFGKISLLDNVPAIVKTPDKATPGQPTAQTKGIGQFHLSPYENIYTAIGCMCPVAILFNLRKLKTIYQVYDCCIEQACKNGISTESCEKQLSEATCMYWEGSLYKMLVKVLLSIITAYISAMLLKIIEKLGLMEFLYCGLAIWDLANVPSTIQGVMSAWEWMTRTFKEPNCEDLGFDDAKRNLESGFTSPSKGISSLTLNDRNNDGRYDSYSKSSSTNTPTTPVLSLIIIKSINKQYLQPITRKASASSSESQYETLINKYAKLRGIDSDLLRAQIQQESLFNPNAKSPSGAIGLMQIMPDTFSENARKLGIKNPDPYDPEQNINVGTYYFSKLRDNYKRAYSSFDEKSEPVSNMLALAAYNGGSGYVNSALQISLQKKGYYYGTIDGVIGPSTRAAMRRAAENNDLPDYNNIIRIISQSDFTYKGLKPDSQQISDYVNYISKNYQTYSGNSISSLTTPSSAPVSIFPETQNTQSQTDDLVRDYNGKYLSLEMNLNAAENEFYAAQEELKKAEDDATGWFDWWVNSEEQARIDNAHNKINEVQERMKVLTQEKEDIENRLKILILPEQYSPYKIQAGDTFTGIAREYGISIEQLRKANPQIDDISKIRAGDTLNIPSSTPDLSNSQTFVPIDSLGLDDENNLWFSNYYIDETGEIVMNYDDPLLYNDEYLIYLDEEGYAIAQDAGFLGRDIEIGRLNLNGQLELNPEQQGFLDIRTTSSNNYEIVCFLADTKITLPDFTAKNIQDIKIGDEILSFNFKNKKTEKAKVISVFKKTGYNYLIINNKIRVTPEHRFYINNKWKEISKAEIGDKLIDEKGNEILIFSIEKIHDKDGFYAYNFKVFPDENYFAEEILVHNEYSVPEIDKILRGATVEEIEVTQEDRIFFEYNLNHPVYIIKPGTAETRDDGKLSGGENVKVPFEIYNAARKAAGNNPQLTSMLIGIWGMENGVSYDENGELSSFSRTYAEQIYATDNWAINYYRWIYDNTVGIVDSSKVPSSFGPWQQQEENFQAYWKEKYNKDITTEQAMIILNSDPQEAANAAVWQLREPINYYQALYNYRGRADEFSLSNPEIISAIALDYHAGTKTSGNTASQIHTAEVAKSLGVTLDDIPKWEIDGKWGDASDTALARVMTQLQNTEITPQEVKANRNEYLTRIDEYYEFTTGADKKASLVAAAETSPYSLAVQKRASEIQTFLQEHNELLGPETIETPTSTQISKYYGPEQSAFSSSEPPVELYQEATQKIAKKYGIELGEDFVDGYAGQRTYEAMANVINAAMNPKTPVTAEDISKNRLEYAINIINIQEAISKGSSIPEIELPHSPSSEELLQDIQKKYIITLTQFSDIQNDFLEAQRQRLQAEDDATGWFDWRVNEEEQAKIDSLLKTEEKLKEQLDILFNEEKSLKDRLGSSILTVEKQRALLEEQTAAVEYEELQFYKGDIVSHKYLGDWGIVTDIDGDGNPVVEWDELQNWDLFLEDCISYDSDVLNLEIPVTPIEMQKHEIKSGETLSAIAAEYQTNTEDLVLANPWITDINNIPAGIQINIPIKMLGLRQFEYLPSTEPINLGTIEPIKNTDTREQLEKQLAQAQTDYVDAQEMQNNNNLQLAQNKIDYYNSLLNQLKTSEQQPSVTEYQQAIKNIVDARGFYINENFKVDGFSGPITDQVIADVINMYNEEKGVSDYKSRKDVENNREEAIRKIMEIQRELNLPSQATTSTFPTILGTTTHTIQRGEDPYEIARVDLIKNGIENPSDYDIILRLNEISDANPSNKNIWTMWEEYEGKEIIIPGETQVTSSRDFTTLKSMTDSTIYSDELSKGAEKIYFGTQTGQYYRIIGDTVFASFSPDETATQYQLEELKPSHLGGQDFVEVPPNTHLVDIGVEDPRGRLGTYAIVPNEGREFISPFSGNDYRTRKIAVYIDEADFQEYTTGDNGELLVRKIGTLEWQEDSLQSYEEFKQNIEFYDSQIRKIPYGLKAAIEGDKIIYIPRDGYVWADPDNPDDISVVQYNPSEYEEPLPEEEIQQKPTVIEKEKQRIVEKQIKEETNKAALEKAAYDLTWRLLNEILGEFAYKTIDEMCKED